MAMIQGIDGSALLAAFRQGRSDRASDDKAQAEKAKRKQIGGLMSQMFPGQQPGGLAGQYASGGLVEKPGESQAILDGFNRARLPGSPPLSLPTMADAFNPQAMGQIGAMDAGGAAPGPVVAPQAPAPQPQRMTAPDPNILAKLTILDPETGGKLATAFKTMADTDLQHHQTRNDMLGAAAHFLERYPPDQRAHMMEIVAPRLMQAGWSPQEIAQADLTDNGLKGYQAVAIDFDKMIDNERAEREMNMPKVVTPQPGAGAFAFSPGTGKIETIVAPNDGTHPTGSPTGTAPVTKTIGGVTYFRTPDGKWHDEPQGGAGGNASGGFPSGG